MAWSGLTDPDPRFYDRLTPLVTYLLLTSFSAASRLGMPGLGQHVDQTDCEVRTLLPARRRPQGLVVIGVCLSVCLSVRTLLSARYLKNGFMDHHQIWWVGAGGEPLEQVQFWC